MTISEFNGSYKFLSNFSPNQVVFNGHRYQTSEHAFQAAKAVDEAGRRWVANAEGPGQAKFRGRRVTKREDWEQIKDGIMLEIIREKFSWSSLLADMLLETDDQELIEGNYWGDTYWGVCAGVGQNKLGKILMQVRQELKNSIGPP